MSTPRTNNADDAGAPAFIVSMGETRSGSARSLTSEAPSRSSMTSPALDDPNFPLSVSGGAGGGGTGGSSHSAAGVSHLAYKHSREARRLIKKEASAALRRSSGASSSGGTSAREGVFEMVMREKEREKEGGLGLAHSDSDREDFSRQSSFKSDGAGGGKLGGMGGSTGRIGRTESPAIGGVVNGAGGKGGRRGGGGGGGAVARPKQSLGKACRILRNMVLGKYLNVLFVFMPLGLMARYMEWGPGPVFFLNFVALIPLASMLGDLTEEVADYMGDTIGGLMNASFGNAVEMVIGVQALVHNEIRIVQSSLLGSVLSNLLLVLGCSFLFGGIKYSEQKFNSTAAVANLALLFLATIALVVPTPIGRSYDLTLREELRISRAAALFLLAMYIQLLFFQMVTHKHLFIDADRGEGRLLTSAGEPAGGREGGVEREVEGMEEEEGEGEEQEEEEEEEEDKLGLWPAVVGLVVVTAIVAVFSELLVASIDDVCSTYDISKVFVGVILIPIVGNATEHMTAVSVAYKNRMELAMGIAVGSATQISVFVIPFLVIAGWIMDKPMTLNFTPVELVLYIMSVIITIPVLSAGSSNWIHGSLLITCYFFIAFAIWHEDETPITGVEGMRRRRLAEGAWEGL